MTRNPLSEEKKTWVDSVLNYFIAIAMKLEDHINKGCNKELWEPSQNVEGRECNWTIRGKTVLELGRIGRMGRQS